MGLLYWTSVSLFLMGWELFISFWAFSIAVLAVQEFSATTCLVFPSVCSVLPCCFSTQLLNDPPWFFCGTLTYRIFLFLNEFCREFTVQVPKLLPRESLTTSKVLVCVNTMEGAKGEDPFLLSPLWVRMVVRDCTHPFSVCPTAFSLSPPSFLCSPNWEHRGQMAAFDQLCP